MRSALHLILPRHSPSLSCMRACCCGCRWKPRPDLQLRQHLGIAALRPPARLPPPVPIRRHLNLPSYLLGTQLCNSPSHPYPPSNSFNMFFP